MIRTSFNTIQTIDVLQAVRDAYADPVYTAIGLLRHRTNEPKQLCELAVQRAAEADLIARAWSPVPLLTDEGAALLQRGPHAQA